MPGTQNASFIPKQGPVKRSRQTASRQLHFFTIISYVFFAATLAASLGVFLFNKHLENQLSEAVGELNNAIGSFSNTDMEMVREFNVRLKQAQGRIEHSVSLSSLFVAIENATAQTVEITEFKLDRKDDTNYELVAKLSTDSFDSSLFQRGVLEGNSIIDTVAVEDVTIGNEDAPGVSFVAKLTVPLDEIPYSPVTTTQPTPTMVTPATTTATSSIVNGTSTERIEGNE